MDFCGENRKQLLLGPAPPAPHSAPPPPCAVVAACALASRARGRSGRRAPLRRPIRCSPCCCCPDRRHRRSGAPTRRRARVGRSALLPRAPRGGQTRRRTALVAAFQPPRSGSRRRHVLRRPNAAPRAPDAHAARSAGRLRPLPHLLRRPQVRCARAGHRSPRRDAQSLADSACCAETLVQGNALARARAEQSHALPGRAASAVAASLFAPPPMAQPPLPGLPTRALSSSALPVPPPVQPPPGCDLAASTLLLPKAVFGAAADEMLLRYVFQPSLCSCCAYLTHRATGPRRCRRPCSRAAPPSRRRARASGQNGASSNLRRHASCFCLL